MTGAVGLVAVAVAVACGSSRSPAPNPVAPTPASSPSAAPPRTAAHNALYVPASSYDFSRNPALLERVAGSAHGYFRFVNASFTNAVCARFGDGVAAMPVVNLHGDAHLEQYAVTPAGRGLADYEDATSGPALIDLARFGVSIYLACQQRGWNKDAPGVVGEFFTGYRRALSDPEFDAPEPSVAGRMRVSSQRSQAEFLAWAESLMDPAGEGREQLEADILSYAGQVLARRPELPAGFFRVKQVGAHHLGVGSALAEKYLFRVEGPSASPQDDLILEIKEIRPATGASCVQRATNLDAMRIAISQARISYRPFRYFGYVRRGGSMFWVHEWAEQYRELSIAGTLRSPAELREVAFDVGVQLGRGHCNQLGSATEADVRRAQLSVLDRQEAALWVAVRELAAESIAAWQRFAAAVAHEG